MKKYLEKFGLIRIICALSVLGIHITSRYIYQYDTAFILNQLFRYCVPIFVILSGYFLFYSDSDKINSNGKTIFFKRLKKILVPYIIWTLVYLLYENRHSIGELRNLNYLKIFLTGHNHLYFFIIILQLYLIYPILKKLFEKGLGRNTLIISIIISFYFQLSIYLYKFGINILPYVIIKYSYLLFPTWLIYFVFGMYYAKNKSLKLKIKSPIIYSVWLISLIGLIIESKITETFAYSVKPSIIIYSFISFYAFMTLVKSFNTSKRNKEIKYLDNMTLNFYLSHPLIMLLLNSVTRILGIENVFNGILGMILLFLSSTMCTFIFCAIIEKLKKRKHLKIIE